jgi:phage terminase large subunit
LLLSLRRKLRILCARELQLSIADSVYRVLADIITELDLDDYFDVLKTTIRSANGSEFIFAGLKHNAKKIKSAEGVDICWVEEADAVSQESLDFLIPTIRKDGSEIWFSYNPSDEKDPIHKMFVVNDPPPDSVVCQIGWQDNPWFPDALRKHKDWLYSVDKDAADHVYGGKTKSISNAQVLIGKVAVESFEPGEGWFGPYQGADWGFAVSPTVLVRCWVTGDPDSLERELWIEHEAFGVGVDINETPELFDSIPDAREYVTRADSARPETVSHMKQHGYHRMESCKKRPDSVKDGIAHLRGYKRIVIHPRCVHAIEQAGLWKFKQDAKTGDVLPILIKLHDDIFDACRYSLEPLISKKGFYFA